MTRVITLLSCKRRPKHMWINYNVRCNFHFVSWHTFKGWFSEPNRLLIVLRSSLYDGTVNMLRLLDSCYSIFAYVWFCIHQTSTLISFSVKEGRIAMFAPLSQTFNIILIRLMELNRIKICCFWQSVNGNRWNFL